MNTLIKITFFSTLALFLFACDTDPVNSNIVDNFDHEGQIPIDQALLDTYFETHYYNHLDEAIWSIGAEGDGALPLGEQVPLSEDAKSEIHCWDSSQRYRNGLYLVLFENSCRLGCRREATFQIGFCFCQLHGNAFGQYRF